MFLLRSAFWLTVAVLVFQPGGLSLSAAADGLSSAITERGQAQAARSITGLLCETVRCPAGPGTEANLPMSAQSDYPMAIGQTVRAELIPMPLPRLDRRG